MATNFNITPRGYGVMRECRVTQRISATHNKPTGLGALLNPPPSHFQQMDANRKWERENGFTPNWHIEKGDMARYDDSAQWKNDATGHGYFDRAMTEHNYADSKLADSIVPTPIRVTDHPDAIRHAELARNSANPVAYITNNVPAKLRANVVAIASR